MSTATYTVPSAPRRGERVHDELERALLEGHIDPDARLTEPKVSAFFGVSRTPVREALARLCAAGILRKCEYGYAPIRPTLEGIRELYELRLVLETAGIDRVIDGPASAHYRAALTAERERWLGLEAAVEVDGIERGASFVFEDERFHVATLAAAGNRELVAALESVNRRIRRVRAHDYAVENRVEATISEHLGILDSLLAGETGRAALLLRAHIGDSFDVVFDRVQGALAAMERDDYTITEIGRALR